MRLNLLMGCHLSPHDNWILSNKSSQICQALYGDFSICLPILLLLLLLILLLLFIPFSVIRILSEKLYVRYAFEVLMFAEPRYLVGKIFH